MEILRNERIGKNKLITLFAFTCLLLLLKLLNFANYIYMKFCLFLSFQF